VAREVLAALADALVCDAPSARPRRTVSSSLVEWLLRHDLAAPFYFAFDVDPEVAARLRPTALSVAATNRAHFEALERIERALAAAAIPFVLLKGAALADSAYGGASRRPMSDLDLWIGSERITAGARVLEGLGYRPVGRPRDGEVQLRPPGRRSGLVELHERAFRGFWIDATASVDETALWRRASPVGPGRAALRLGSEDELLHVACHLVTNHLEQAPLRTLLDLALLTRSRAIDWGVLAERARLWRIATATWLALDLAERSIGLPGAARALEQLRPSRLRRVALGRAIEHAKRALPFACIDRARDAVRFPGRAVWPERSWLVARYGADASRLAHLRALVGAP
jgi:hypothetical protein